jgi:hypothetical protein
LTSDVVVRAVGLETVADDAEDLVVSRSVSVALRLPL